MECRICGNHTNNTLYKVPEMMFGTREFFDYFECSDCKCLQILEIPGEISKYYPSEYYSFSKLDESKFKGWYGSFRLLKYKSSYHQKGLLNGIFRLLFQKRDYDLFHDLPIKNQSKILDVGAGNGEFLYRLHTLGFKNTLGIDPFLKEEISYISGLEVKKKSIFEISSGWDVITYSHVFEHVENPLRELACVTGKLNPGGICIIQIPTVSSYAWQKYGINWYQIDAPRHFHLHSLKSMQILADQAGLEIIKVLYNSGFKQFYYSELNEKRIPMVNRPKIKGLNKIGWKLKKFDYTRRSKILNKKGLGDQFGLVLIKKGSKKPVRTVT